MIEDIRMAAPDFLRRSHIFETPVDWKMEIMGLGFHGPLSHGW